MKNIPKEWLVLAIISVLVVAVGVSEWRKNPPAPTANITASNNSGNKLEKEAGNVTISVEYLPIKSDETNSSFEIALNTHSVDFSNFDFSKDVSLEKGGKNISPVKVEVSGGGHHRSAQLTFPVANKPFTIMVKNISNLPRQEFNFN